MAQIKENVRTGLSNLTGTYLREVIRGLQDNPDMSVLRSIPPQGLEALFARIDEAILPAADKRLLQTKITDILEGQAIGSEDRVIAHFLSKLVLLYRQQQENESDVREFVQLCNAYLTSKQFVYDETNYEVYVRQTDSRPTDSTQKLELKVLSSGEKQIVSLFSHIYLSGQSRFFVVIDEPELSLSVSVAAEVPARHHANREVHGLGCGHALTVHLGKRAGAVCKGVDRIYQTSSCHSLNC